MSFWRTTLAARPDIWPLVLITSFGALFGTTMLVRAGTRYHDVSWRHESNPFPYEKLKYNQKTKLMHIASYDHLKDEVPKF
ncbi:hypothetical protein GBAR_LOCUS31361 [Geodia barretti]|jgi:hypothetical protein|uniref:Uncharacterized protein n=1 Tax=Geodia barretti TaxID=519541 RepID=A0AA35XM50_GEOBA|nr:hypothetical protein GBAR_LOCUS31361 [Geodia barretti]